jgi:hypothetical protein
MTAEVDSLKIDVELSDILGEKKSFTTLKSLANFFEKEISFWHAEVASVVNHAPVNSLLQALNAVVQDIHNYKNSFAQWDDSTRQQKFQQLLARVQQQAIKVGQIQFASAPLRASRMTS